MVNQTNKQTFAPPLVGFLLGCFFKVCNLAGAECPINSEVYHSFKSSRHTPCAVTGVTITFYLFLLHISKLKRNVKSKTECPWKKLYVVDK